MFTVCVKIKLLFYIRFFFHSYSHFLDKKSDKIIINTDTSDDIVKNPIINDESLTNDSAMDNHDSEPIEEEIENDKIDTNNITKEVDPQDYIDKEKKKDDNNENLVIEDEEEIIEGDLKEEIKKQNKYLQYKLPDIDYLDNAIEIKTHSEDELKQKADQLTYALNSFGVAGNVVKISPGPVITLFEIEPAEGVRVSKFTNLSEDLSRIMGGKRVRIIAPIPGSKSVGIELPNESPSIVYMKNILNSKKYIENKSKLKIALGKTTTGDAFFFELNKMPHLLVAGATGAGKSVCINTIIVSILYNAKPDEVKFILMDPKKVELTTYKSLVGYHLITAKHLDE